MSNPIAAADAAAVDAYEALAPFYDDFTASYPHRRWLAELEIAARRYGARGHRVLDIGCGTGKSSLPLQERGYEITACDVSPTMVAAARKRLALRPERCLVADMRWLPDLGPFDLAFCLDDAVNYLMSAEDLVAALTSIGRTLRVGGLLVFDVNTIATYATVFGRDFLRHGDAASYHWRGQAQLPVQADEVFAAQIEVVRRGRWVASSFHQQRHHSPKAIGAALRESGLTHLATLGQSPGGRLSESPQERRHVKLVYVVQR